MNIWYILIGIVCVGLGIYLTIKQIKIFTEGKQDSLGFDVKGFGVGIMLIVLGVAMIIQNL
jgi:hypothetical protein